VPDIGRVPLVVLSLGSYLAGLLTGFAGSSGSLIAALGVAAVAGAIGWRRGPFIGSTFALLVAAGFGIARATTAASVS